MTDDQDPSPARHGAPGLDRTDDATALASASDVGASNVGASNGGASNGGASDGAGPSGGLPRRKLLLGGAAIGASVVVSIRPALANVAASVLHCQIPVPDPARSGQYVASDGRLVPAGTEGAFPGSPRPYTGEEVKAALRRGRPLPGTSYDQNRAYLNYIRRLQGGTSGFTCYASLQMPR